jgi:hypothetical protein
MAAKVTGPDDRSGETVLHEPLQGPRAAYCPEGKATMFRFKRVAALLVLLKRRAGFRKHPDDAGCRGVHHALLELDRDEREFNRP